MLRCGRLLGLAAATLLLGALLAGCASTSTGQGGGAGQSMYQNHDGGGGSDGGY